MSLRSRFFLLCCLGPCLWAQDGGFRPVIGGLVHDSGVALGIEYARPRVLGSPVDFRARAIGSTKKYEYLEVRGELPRLADGHLFVELAARYRNYPEEDFWGLGPKSPRERRSTFRLEDVQYAGTLGIRPKRWLHVGATGGLLEVNTGPGKDKGHPTVEQRFDVSEVPALDRQPDYYLAGTFLEVDYRDSRSDPRSGGNYRLELTYHGDRDFHRFSFRRYELELRQFVPVFGERGTLALHGLTSLIDTSPGQQVPFFMQRTVGGGRDLRAFLQNRFRDKNLLVFNVECRWSVHSWVEVVAFGDAGRVYSRRDQFGLGDLEGSVGLGGRLKFQGAVFLGLDVAVGREGVKAWFRGGHTF